jgi:four helix bundle protein
MSTIKSHRDLIAWQKAVELVTACYEVTRSFPADERFGLTQQLRRAAVSVPANIAEGKGRGTSKELNRFLTIAGGSLTELDTHLVVANKLGYVTQDKLGQLVGKLEEVGRIITGLRKSLRS